MGAWGTGAFDNDSALDWLTELESQGVTALRRQLTGVAATEAEEYLDIDDGAASIAAAEIVAAALGHGRHRVPEQANAWIDANSEEIVQQDLELARRAAERAVDANSELRALWDEGGANTGWHEDVGALLRRLGGAPIPTLAAATEGTELTPRTAQDAAHLQQARATLLAALRARGLDPDDQ